VHTGCRKRASWCATRRSRHWRNCVSTCRRRARRRMPSRPPRPSWRQPCRIFWRCCLHRMPRPASRCALSDTQRCTLNVRPGSSHTLYSCAWLRLTQCLIACHWQALSILAGLPEHLCDRCMLLRRLLARESPAQVDDGTSRLADLMQAWLPCGKRPADYAAWAAFLEACSDCEARPARLLRACYMLQGSADSGPNAPTCWLEAARHLGTVASVACRTHYHTRTR